MKSGSGIVIEINNRKATLLMKDGTFVTVRIPAGKDPSVGREYQASYFSERKRSLFVLPSVAALLAVVLLSGLIPTGNQSAAAAYVSFDINPSLEVGVDKEMRVIQIDAFNDEAKKIIKKYDLNVENNFSFESFAAQLINAYEKEGYMKSDHSMLITTISSEEGNDKTEEALDEAVDSIVRKTVVKYPVRITVSESNTDTREKAKQLGVSSGKYKAFQTANLNGQPLKEEKIKEVKFQELKVNAVSSNDIKSVPHPRKMKTEADNQKKDIKIAAPKTVVPKKEAIKQKEEKKQRVKPHNHDNHHKKTQEKLVKPLVKPKEKKIKHGDNKYQNRVFNKNGQKNDHNQKGNDHHKKNQHNRNKQQVKN